MTMARTKRQAKMKTGGKARRETVETPCDSDEEDDKSIEEVEEEEKEEEGDEDEGEGTDPKIDNDDDDDDDTVNDGGDDDEEKKEGKEKSDGAAKQESSTRVEKVDILEEGYPFHILILSYYLILSTVQLNKLDLNWTNSRQLRQLSLPEGHHKAFVIIDTYDPYLYIFLYFLRLVIWSMKAIRRSDTSIKRMYNTIYFRLCVAIQHSVGMHPPAYAKECACPFYLTELNSTAKQAIRPFTGSMIHLRRHELPTNLNDFQVKLAASIRADISEFYVRNKDFQSMDYLPDFTDTYFTHYHHKHPPLYPTDPLHVSLSSPSVQLEVATHFNFYSSQMMQLAQKAVEAYQPTTPYAIMLYVSQFVQTSTYILRNLEKKRDIDTMSQMHVLLGHFCTFLGGSLNFHKGYSGMSGCATSASTSTKTTTTSNTSTTTTTPTITTTCPLNTSDAADEK